MTTHGLCPSIWLRVVSLSNHRGFLLMSFLPLFLLRFALCAMRLAFFHLITLSALASTFGGIVRPICLAVFRLITNSNFVGCSTGKSAGFPPFRNFFTYV